MRPGGSHSIHLSCAVMSLVKYHYCKGYESQLPVNMPAADHLMQSSVSASQFSSCSNIEQNEPPAVPCCCRKPQNCKRCQGRRRVREKVGRTTCLFTSSKGLLTVFVVTAWPLSAYRLNPAPGNQLGIYFTSLPESGLVHGLDQKV